MVVRCADCLMKLASIDVSQLSSVVIPVFPVNLLADSHTSVQIWCGLCCTLDS